ncbi:hypothetical protein Fmac_003152 [Flemingia macrophylla]|uniref:ATPase AAA-type core domain-containing protein n=1 Tax=Flemingia macrophylla TaxID=520843 RepID=A0ABD1NLY6_9FABA
MRAEMESCTSNSSDSKNHLRAEEAIGGNAQALQALRELIIFPLHFSHEAQKLGLKWPRGLLLYGPPGTGKLFWSVGHIGQLSVHTLFIEHMLVKVREFSVRLFQRLHLT